jgi:hypothetical protein
VFLIYLREWIGYCFDLSAVKENAIISIANGLLSHKEIIPVTTKTNPSLEQTMVRSILVCIA